MITQCCECRKVCADDRWVAPEVLSAVDERVSHGYCPSCYEKARQEVDAYRFNTSRAYTPASD
jgi:hypothetical protein